MSYAQLKKESTPSGKREIGKKYCNKEPANFDSIYPSKLVSGRLILANNSKLEGPMRLIFVLALLCLFQNGCAAMQAALAAPNADEQKWIAKVSSDSEAISQKPAISAWLTGDKAAKKIADHWAEGGPAIKTEESRPKRLAFENSLGNPNTALGKAWLKHRANLQISIDYAITGLEAVDQRRAAKSDPYFCREEAKRFKNNHPECASPWVNSGLCYFDKALGKQWESKTAKEGLLDLREELKSKTKELGDESTALAAQCYGQKSGSTKPLEAFYTGSDKKALLTKVRAAWNALGSSDKVLRIVAYQKKWKRLQSVHVTRNYGEFRDASRLQFIVYVQRGKFARGYVAEIIKNHVDGDEIRVIIHREESQRYGSTDVGLQHF